MFDQIDANFISAIIIAVPYVVGLIFGMIGFYLFQFRDRKAWLFILAVILGYVVMFLVVRPAGVCPFVD